MGCRVALPQPPGPPVGGQPTRKPVRIHKRTDVGPTRPAGQIEQTPAPPGRGILPAILTGGLTAGPAVARSAPRRNWADPSPVPTGRR